MQSQEFQFLQDFFKKQSGYQLAQGKEYLLESCLRNTMNQHEIPSLPILVSRLKMQDTSLQRDVIQAMTINETMFFRDKTPFEQLENNIFPALVANSQNRQIRVWCTACSSGQEPYSVAMLWDSLRHKYPGYTLSILATDLSEEMVARGQKGVYSDIEVQRSLPAEMRDKYFVQRGNQWSINEEMRKMVTFRAMNLMHVPMGIGPFDLILCRNVLIYFEAPQKKDVLSALRKTIRQPGYLLVGASEVLSGLTTDFQLHPDWRGVYKTP